MSVIITTIITQNFIHRMATLITGISFPIGVALTMQDSRSSTQKQRRTTDITVGHTGLHLRNILQRHWIRKHLAPGVLAQIHKEVKHYRTVTYENLDNRCHNKVSNEQPGIVLIAFAKISVGNLASSRFFTFPVSLRITFLKEIFLEGMRSPSVRARIKNPYLDIFVITHTLSFTW